MVALLLLWRHLVVALAVVVAVEDLRRARRRKQGMPLIGVSSGGPPYSMLWMA